MGNTDTRAIFDKLLDDSPFPVAILGFIAQADQALCGPETNNTTIRCTKKTLAERIEYNYSCSLQSTKVPKHVPKCKHVTTPVDFNENIYALKVRHMVKNLAELVT